MYMHSYSPHKPYKHYKYDVLVMYMHSYSPHKPYKHYKYDVLVMYMYTHHGSRTARVWDRVSHRRFYMCVSKREREREKTILLNLKKTFAPTGIPDS